MSKFVFMGYGCNLLHVIIAHFVAILFQWKGKSLKSNFHQSPRLSSDSSGVPKTAYKYVSGYSAPAQHLILAIKIRKGSNYKT